jgi:hypothetical protein
MKQLDRTDFENLDKDIVAKIAKENDITFHHNCAKRSIVSAILNMDASEASEEAIRASIAKHTKRGDVVEDVTEEEKKEDSFTNPKDGQGKQVKEEKEKPVKAKTAKEVKIIISELVSTFVKNKDYKGLGEFISFLDGETSALRTIYKQLSKKNTPVVKALSLPEMQAINKKIRSSIIRVEPKQPRRKRNSRKLK